jgi:hypothetical protein
MDSALFCYSVTRPQINILYVTDTTLLYSTVVGVGKGILGGHWVSNYLNKIESKEGRVLNSHLRHFPLAFCIVFSMLLFL